MSFTDDETKLLKHLVEQELKKFEEEEEQIRPLVPQFLAIEEKYNEFLQKLLKKF